MFLLVLHNDEPLRKHFTMKVHRTDNLAGLVGYHDQGSDLIA